MLRIAPLFLLALAACNPTSDEVEKDQEGVSDDDPDQDGDGFTESEDCDDDDASVNPGVLEVCDEVDNDCDGDVDEEVRSTYYADTDGDSYGSVDETEESCLARAGWVETAGDCDDADEAVHPGATEVCDGVDNNCDGEIDDNDSYTWYADADSDGFGDPDVSTVDCAAPSGFVLDGTDCDDTTPDANPDATEICDELDNDCDGEVDELVTTTYYEDRDSDDYGDDDATQEACATPEGYAEAGGDCDEDEPAVNPGATEICNEVDDDCDGLADDADGDLDTSSGSSWYADSDSDGYGDASSSAMACIQPSGMVADDSDCDDSSAAVNPAASEVCNDPESGPVDDDCDGDIDDADSSLDSRSGSTWYDDDDSDGYGDPGDASQACDQPTGTVSDATDCDDDDGDVHPAADEICNGTDDDCDGDIDDADRDVDTSTGTEFYADTDSDGYGDADEALDACELPEGYADDALDCDDSDGDVNPGADEICNEIDDDCDGDIDDADSDVDGSSGATWYADGDSDGFGDSTSAMDACEQPTGYVSDDDDCDDADEEVNPDAAEACDGVDNDCDGSTDPDSEVLGDAEDCAADDCADILAARASASDGVYFIDPAGAGAYEAYCDMSNDDGGWTLLLSADGDSSYWGNNASSWDTDGTDTTAPASLTDADYHSPAYGELVTDDIRLCYEDGTQCYVFEHSEGLALLEFFTGGTTHTEYAYDSYWHTDTGSSTVRSDYLTAIGFTAVSRSCYWLGINDTSTYSAIGLLGDSNGGCASKWGGGGHAYHDDLAIGVGLQHCYDSNGCDRGSTGHAAGDTRGANGVENSGNYGPWHVFGR